MLWRTHTLVGISSLWLLAPLPNVLTTETIGPLAVLATLGALLPDLDAQQSKIRSLEVRGLRPFVPLSLLANRAFGHRGLLHSLPGWLGFGLFMPCIGPLVGLGGVPGPVSGVQPPGRRRLHQERHSRLAQQPEQAASFAATGLAVCDRLSG